MITRRDLLQLTASTGAALTLPAQRLRPQTSPAIITRRIPSSREALPVIGLGGAATFSSLAGSDNFS